MRSPSAEFFAVGEEALVHAEPADRGAVSIFAIQAPTPSGKNWSSQAPYSEFVT
jgi:hypothetical protein